MRRFIVAALAAVISTSAIAAESYTGQIVGDDTGRYKILIVERYDTLWKLCTRGGECRGLYPGKNKDWLDFLSRVSGLNGKDMNRHRLILGESIKLPISVGTAEAFGKLDWTIKTQVATTKSLTVQTNALMQEKASLTGRVLEQAGTIAGLKRQVEMLIGLNGQLQDSLDLTKVLLAIALLFIIAGLLGLIYLWRGKKEESVDGSRPQAVRVSTSR